MLYSEQLILNNGGFHFLDVKFEPDYNNPVNHTQFIENYPALFQHRQWDIGLKYFYIEVKEGRSFKYTNLSDYIPFEILSQIRDRSSNVHLLINNSHEAFDSVIEFLYSDVIIRQEIPAEKIFFINNSFDVGKKIEIISNLYCQPIVKAETVTDFEAAASYQLRFDNDFDIKSIPETLVKENIKKTYLNFNRRWRPHRPPFVSLLASLDMLDYGYVSFGKSDFSQTMREIYHGMLQTNSFFPEMYNIMLENEEKIVNLPEMYLDYKDLVTNRAALDLGPGYLYAQSLMSVVSETYYYTKFPQHETARFLSEKTFKPIMFKHPFIILSVPNILSAIRQIGYQTFDGIIDESYDKELSDGNRMMAVIREIQRIRNFNDAELTDFINKCREVTEYNQKVFLSKTKFCYRVNYI